MLIWFKDGEQAHIDLEAETLWVVYKALENSADRMRVQVTVRIFGHPVFISLEEIDVPRSVENAIRNGYATIPPPKSGSTLPSAPSWPCMPTVPPRSDW